MRSICILAFLAIAFQSSQGFAQTAQERFDQGTLALQNQEYDKALSVFEGLESLSIKNKDVQSVIKIRKGEALFYLGRKIEAQTYLSDALATIDHFAPNYQPDIYSANSILGKIATDQFDYGAAANYYRAAAKAAPSNNSKLNVMAGATMAAMFNNTDEALRIATEANELAQTAPDVDKEILAQTDMLLGRVYLNRQEYTKARRHSFKAVSKLGGLTRRVKLNDIQARSDHATASALLDDPESMRHYLSYTGAGRFEGSAFLKASDVQLPICDPANGIMPEDVVIVEMGISKKGEVFYSRPIYSNKPTRIAIPFAKAVKNWSWTQEEVATIDPFYRALTRLELRCTQKTPAQPSPRAFLKPAFDEWIGDSRFTRSDGLSNAAFATRLIEAEGETYESGQSDKRAVSIWTLLASNNAVTFYKRNQYANKALTAAKALSAPADVRAYLHLLRFYDHRDKSLNALKELKANGDLNQNSEINAVLALTINDQEKRGSKSEYVIGLMQEVIEDSALPEKHPLKIGAQVRLASLYQQLGSEDYARETFQQTGLSADQCAAIDSKPKLLSTGSVSKLYPTDMLRMNITGFSKAEYDITADGKVINQRIVMAYPPFGFTKASEKIVARGKFEKSYRPDGGLGCSNDTNFIRFQIPGSPS